MPKFQAVIQGNDSFFLTIVIEASNIELALAAALKQMDAYAKCTIEKLTVTCIKQIGHS